MIQGGFVLINRQFFPKSPKLWTWIFPRFCYSEHGLGKLVESSQ